MVDNWLLITGQRLEQSVISRVGVVGLKLGRNSYAIVTAIVACSLFAAGLAECHQSGIAAALQSWRGALRMITYYAGAVGVIWLGWCWLRLARAITSTARRLKTEQAPHFGSEADPLIDELIGAINYCLEGDSKLIEQLDEQVKDLQVQTQLSERQKKNTEAIIYSLRDAVIVVDEFDRLLMANEVAAGLFNFDFNTARHKPIGELVDTPKSEFVDLMRHSRQSKVEAKRRELEFTEEAGPRTFDCIVSCVHDQNQQVCGLVAVLHDITREKEISQMKNDFVSHVSHELKTPLASITAYSEMLVDGEADDEQTRKEFYSVIQNQAKRLNRLIEDILNISRIESGLTKIEKTPVSLTILIEEQLQMIRNYAEEKNIEVVAQKPIVYDQVYADRDMISQVIVNLLSNAVKYTPSGGTVKVETMVDEIARIAQVTVTDTGVGIPRDEVEHVFDKFYRVGVNKSQAKGTGLGLNLVKQIIEKVHGGRVFVVSEPGVGSTFGFEVPLATREAVKVV